jgi:hypothetical protein
LNFRSRNVANPRERVDLGWVNCSVAECLPLASSRIVVERNNGLYASSFPTNHKMNSKRTTVKYVTSLHEESKSLRGGNTAQEFYFSAEDTGKNFPRKLSVQGVICQIATTLILTAVETSNVVRISSSLSVHPVHAIA